MAMETKRKKLEAQVKQARRQIARRGPWIEGSLVSTARVCGKTNCACHRGGAKHPVLYLTGKLGGKTVSLYVPRKLEAEVRRWAENYKRLKQLTRQVSELQKEIVRLREE